LQTQVKLVASISWDTVSNIGYRSDLTSMARRTGKEAHGWSLLGLAGHFPAGRDYWGWF
jgi:hypothetical protein